MDRGKTRICPSMFKALLKYVGYEDIIVKDKDKKVLGYVNNEDYWRINPKLKFKKVKLYKSKTLSTKPGREGKEIIIITLLER